ncbi:hypothetical protein AH814_22230 [Salmonella enterica subsp. enterica serovar Rubislaw]|nr:hypothetical protein [Salmonella enterica subsp. enterica serovar Rubislaw]
MLWVLYYMYRHFWRKQTCYFLVKEPGELPGFFVSVVRLRDALERYAGKFPGECLQWAAFVRVTGCRFWPLRENLT